VFLPLHLKTEIKMIFEIPVCYRSFSATVVVVVAVIGFWVFKRVKETARERVIQE